MTAHDLEPRLLQVIAMFRAGGAGAKNELSEVLGAHPDERALALLEKLKRAERLTVQWDIDAALEELQKPAAAPEAPSSGAESGSSSTSKGRRSGVGRSKAAGSRNLRVGAEPRFLRWLTDGDLACIDVSHVVHRVDPSTMLVTATLDRHGRGGATGFDIDRSGKRLVTFTWEGILRVWDETGALQREIEVDEEGGFGCALLDEGRSVVVASTAQQNSRGVRLFDVRTGEPRGALDVSAPRFVVPLVSTGSDAEDVLVVDIDEGVLLHSWRGRTRAYGFPGLYGAHAEDDDSVGFSVAQVAASAGWGVALLGQDGIATVWNSEVGRTRMTLAGEYQRLAITPLSDRLLAARGDQVEIWDLDERSRLGRLSTGTASLLKVTDDLAFVGAGDEIGVWRISDRKRLRQIRLDSPAKSVACRGREVFVASTSGEIVAVSIEGIDLPPTDFGGALALGDKNI